MMTLSTSVIIWLIINQFVFLASLCLFVYRLGKMKLEGKVLVERRYYIVYRFVPLRQVKTKKVLNAGPNLFLKDSDFQV